MKVVQLICNHQVAVRFRSGAPLNAWSFSIVATNIQWFAERFAEQWPLVTLNSAQAIHAQDSPGKEKATAADGLFAFYAADHGRGSAGHHAAGSS